MKIGITFGGYCPLIVLTDSMDPEIKSGDLIICQTIDAKDVKVGDVIKVRIMEVDEKRKRISLTMKDVKPKFIKSIFLA